MARFTQASISTQKFPNVPEWQIARNKKKDEWYANRPNHDSWPEGSPNRALFSSDNAPKLGMLLQGLYYQQNQLYQAEQNTAKTEADQQQTAQTSHIAVVQEESTTIFPLQPVTQLFKDVKISLCAPLKKAFLSARALYEEMSGYDLFLCAQAVSLVVGLGISTLDAVGATNILSSANDFSPTVKVAVNWSQRPDFPVTVYEQGRRVKTYVIG